MTNLSPIIVKNRELLMAFHPYRHVIDATVGNGHDSLFLAPLCEQLDGIDIQPLAIRRAHERLAPFTHVHLHQDNFTNIAHYRTDRLDLVCFNLGFLPGASKTIRTEVNETIPAVLEAYHCLVEGGHLSIAVYPRHPGGQDELEEIKKLVQEHAWTSDVIEFESHDTLFMITKR